MKMRKVHFASFLLLLIAGIIMVACGKKEQPQESPLVGTWDLVSVDSWLNGVPDESAEDDDTPVSYEFKADSTFVHEEDGISEKGRWLLDRDLLHLYSIEEEKCMLYQVEHFVNDSLFVYLHDSIDGDFIEEHHIYIKRKK